MPPMKVSPQFFQEHEYLPKYTFIGRITDFAIKCEKWLTPSLDNSVEDGAVAAFAGGVGVVTFTAVAECSTCIIKDNRLSRPAL